MFKMQVGLRMIELEVYSDRKVRFTVSTSPEARQTLLLSSVEAMALSAALNQAAKESC